TFSSPKYQQAVQETVDFLTALCEPLDDSQFVHIQQIFTTATRMEIGFWQMGLDLS
ncbi:MAG: thiaminase II, partial [Haemophilus haemolyticus]|nr:thiaminase II [Haemophilus haemolyticus]